ncbi:hypothetical protein NDU88_000313 [Pleurodeles waltl]|uniref:Uncharacterized protein n=1 Tax=Pleurodeles waltl TaxID=8319 RepID=A0AAV7UQP7_PLEWA|nr:hypothetical protein NDU88_000313 [Pleurodeles waltl]
MGVAKLEDSRGEKRRRKEELWSHNVNLSSGSGGRVATREERRTVIPGATQGELCGPDRGLLERAEEERSSDSRAETRSGLSPSSSLSPLAPRLESNKNFSAPTEGRAILMLDRRRPRENVGGSLSSRQVRGIRTGRNKDVCSPRRPGTRLPGRSADGRGPGLRLPVWSGAQDNQER